MAELHLNAEQLNELRGILKTHLPPDASVHAFGSRASGIGLKAHSDLDLLVGGQGKLPLRDLANLREALTESNLPFSVDILEARDAEPKFLLRLKRIGLVELF